VRLILALVLASASLILTPTAFAIEIPSFMQSGDAFCTDEDDFNGFVTRGHARANSATDTCRVITRPTRVAILNGAAGLKTMVRLMSGSNAYEVGWTNGKLPVQ
jgi:hypothetical protein